MKRRLKKFGMMSLMMTLVLVMFGWNVACTPAPSDEKKQEQTTDAGEKTPQEVTPDASNEATPEKKAEVTPEKTTEPTSDASEPTSDASEPTPEMGEPIKEDVQETQPDTTPSPSASVVVFNNDYVKGKATLTTVDVANAQLIGKMDGVALDTPDSVIKIASDKKSVFVLSRYNNPTKEDTIAVYANGAKKTTVKLGAKANPQDVVEYNSKVYISLYGRNYILHGTLDGKLEKIDLSSLSETSNLKCSNDDDCKGSFGSGTKKCLTKAGVCESDGLPEVSKMVVFNDKLYALIQGLDRNQGFKPIKSCVAEIDLKTNKLLTCLALKGTNPTAIVPMINKGEWAMVLAGTTGKDDDSGIQILTPGRKDKVGRDWMITKKELGANSLTFGGELVFVSSNKAYIITNDKSYKQALVKFDPSASTHSPSIIIQPTSLAGLALVGKSWVVVGDKGSKSIRVFDGTTDKEDTAKKTVVTAYTPAGLVTLP